MFLQLLPFLCRPQKKQQLSLILYYTEKSEKDDVVNCLRQCERATVLSAYHDDTHGSARPQVCADGAIVLSQSILLHCWNTQVARAEMKKKGGPSLLWGNSH